VGRRKPRPVIAAAAIVSGVTSLDPLPLDPLTVASAGYVRAAFTATSGHPLVQASFALARARGLPALSAHMNAVGELARRSVEAHAQRADAPPF
jgi:hypothetical protein